MQDVAAQWLTYARAEADLASRLITMGLEKAAKQHAAAGEKCMRLASQACENRNKSAGARLVSELEEYRLFAEHRAAHSESLLAA